MVGGLPTSSCESQLCPDPPQWLRGDNPEPPGMCSGDNSQNGDFGIPPEARSSLHERPYSVTSRHIWHTADGIRPQSPGTPHEAPESCQDPFPTQTDPGQLLLSKLARPGSSHPDGAEMPPRTGLAPPRLMSAVSSPSWQMFEVQLRSQPEHQPRPPRSPKPLTKSLLQPTGARSFLGGIRSPETSSLLSRR